MSGEKESLLERILKPVRINPPAVAFTLANIASFFILKYTVDDTGVQIFNNIFNPLAVGAFLKSYIVSRRVYKKDREYLKLELRNLNMLIRDKSINIGLRKFFKEKQKRIRNILFYSKKKVGYINSIINTTGNKNFFKKFVEIAEKELTKSIFKKIKDISMEEIKIS